QSLEREAAAELQVGQDGSAETRIRSRLSSGNLTLRDLGTHPVDEALGAERGDSQNVEPAARDHQACIGAPRKAEEADASTVEFRSLRPRVEHEVGQAPDVGGAVDQDRQGVDTAAIRRVVTGMVNGSNDEARVRECRS